MRRIHLGMWFRTVIVLSIAWMAVGTYVHFQKNERQLREIWMAGQWSCMEFAHQLAVRRRAADEPPPSLTQDTCLRQAEEASQRTDALWPINLRDAAGETLGQLIAGWIAAFLAYWAFRWVIAGRRREPELQAAE